jgi:hypothetical protein
MTNFYPDFASNSCILFSVFSQPEFDKSKKYSLTASTFITERSTFKFNDTILHNLLENKFTHIFVVSNDYPTSDSVEISINGVIFPITIYG